MIKGNIINEIKLTFLSNTPLKMRNNAKRVRKLQCDEDINLGSQQQGLMRYRIKIKSL